MISIWILIGIWLEKFLLVTPSLVKSKSLPLGIFEILITMGWLGLFAFCVCSFLQKYPVLAVSDPKLAVALETEEGRCTWREVRVRAVVQRKSSR